MAGDLHPLIETAAREARLPEWAACGPTRREHAARVAELLDSWARELSLSERERRRWRAAGHLHDALKDAPPAELRPIVGPGWPESLLHAPACAARLEQEGVRDAELLTAIAHHSTGHPDFETLGESLYLADFLEPGRPDPTGERARLRERLPGDRVEVLARVMALRIHHLLERRRAILPATLGLWNRLAAS
ncbi:MAG: HD domain-containing protein [Gemmatimonadota bacterium]|nr:HD domain-containing protein [Gemmatimonadota bacterium]